MSLNLLPLAREYKRDHHHEIGLVILVTANLKQWAVAVVDTATGDLLAYDGKYNEPMPASEHRTPIRELPEWTDRDTMISQATLSRLMAWLQALDFKLFPEFSLTAIARTTLDSWGARGTQELGNDWHAVAYYPTTLSILEAEKLVSDGVPRSPRPNG